MLETIPYSPTAQEVETVNDADTSSDVLIVARWDRYIKNIEDAFFHAADAEYKLCNISVKCMKARDEELYGAYQALHLAYKTLRRITRRYEEAKERIREQQNKYDTGKTD